MPTTDLDIANSALTKLGESIVSSISSPTTPAAEACANRIEFCRRTVLRSHPWNFAIDRRTLTLAAVTNVVNNGGGLCRVTVATHGFTTGNKVSISGVLGTAEANGTWTVTVIDPNTFDLQTSSFVNTYISDGVAGLAAEYDWTFRHSLPSDSLRLLHVNNDSEKWRVEGAYILSTEETLEIKIVTDFTNYDGMDPLFHEALAYYLAWDICYKLSQNHSLKNQMLEDYTAIVRKAKFVNATEEPAEQIESDHFLEARIAGAVQYVRDPMT
jgi:hypothetical protein